MRVKKDNQNKETGRGVRPDFPIVGRVSVGELIETASGKKYPTSRDYFRITPTLPAMSAQVDAYCQTVKQYFNLEKLNQLPIIFTSDNIAEISPNYLELRDSAGKTLYRTDNVTVWQAQPRTNEHKAEWVAKSVAEIEEKMPFAEWKKARAEKSNARWVERLILRFQLVNFPTFGCFEFQTAGAESTIPQILKVLDATLETLGTLQNTPFFLTVKKVKSDKAGDTSCYPVVSMHPIPNEKTAPRLTQSQGFLLGGASGLLELQDRPHFEE